MVFDSDLNNKYLMPENYPLNREKRAVPVKMARAFRVDVQSGGAWKTVARVDNNYQRLVRLPIDSMAASIRFVLEDTWGADTAHVFACDIR